MMKMARGGIWSLPRVMHEGESMGLDLRRLRLLIAPLDNRCSLDPAPHCGASGPIGPQLLSLCSPRPDTLLAHAGGALGPGCSTASTTLMRFGISASGFGELGQLVARAQWAEAAGFSTFAV